MTKRYDIILVKTLGSLMALILLVGTVACQKKCQPTGQPLTGLTGTDFRLIDTNDPQFKTLTQTNFIIMNFDDRYKGNVYRVENNEKYDNPALTFEYNVDPTRKEIRLQYYKPAQAAASGGGQAAATPGDAVGGVKSYTYHLGTGFEMHDENSTNYYRFVPFQGIVKPDDICTFK